MNSFIRSVRLLTRTERRALAGIILLRVVAQGLDLVGLLAVWFLGQAAASFVEQGSDYSPPLTIFEEPNEFIAAVALGVLIIFISKSLISGLLLRQTTRWLAKVDASHTATLFKNIFSSAAPDIETHSESYLLWLLRESAFLAFSSVLFAGITLIVEGALFIAVLALFLWADWTLASGLAVFFVALVIIYQRFVNRPLREVGLRIGQADQKMGELLMDAIRSIRESVVIGTNHVMVRKVAEERREYAHHQGLRRFNLALPRFIIEAALALALFTFVVAQLYFSNLGNGLATLGLFLVGSARLIGTVLPIQSALTDLRLTAPNAEAAQSTIEKLAEMRDEPKLPSSIVEHSRARSKRGQGFSVKAEDLSFAYPASQGNRVLDNVCFSIKPGAFVAVVGPSGAGKSTLADLLTGFSCPTSGLLEIDGSSPRHITRQNPGSIAFVPQKPGLISGSILDNLLLGRDSRDFTAQQVNDVLRRVGIAEVVDSLPNKIENYIGPQRNHLSGGQLQRLGIARALLGNPSLLVLDEATNALDAESEQVILETLVSLRGSVTVVAIAHKNETAAAADSVLLVKDGKASFAQAWNGTWE